MNQRSWQQTNLNPEKGQLGVKFPESLQVSVEQERSCFLVRQSNLGSRASALQDVDAAMQWLHKTGFTPCLD